MGWSGLKNGELLSSAAADYFDAVVTMDSGVPYQQHAAALPIAVVVLRAASNEIADIRPLIPALLSALEILQPRTIVIVS
jgi:hypothetical protein